LKNWLYKPFPFIKTFKQALLISLFVGVFVFLFLYIFKPFGIEDMPSSLGYLGGYGLIAFVSVFFSLKVLPVLIPGIFGTSEWNILKNILFMSWILLIISFLNWFYALYKFSTLTLPVSIMEQIPTGFIENVGMTYSVGIFPILIINYILEKQFYTQNTKLAKVVSNAIENASNLSGNHLQFDIPLDEGKAASISSKDLILVKAEGGNYVTVYWQVQNELKSQLWRNTLKKLMSTLGSDQNILQCHKSYLINRSYIQEVTGNARTLALQLQQIDFEIPVSRNFPRELVENYQL
jgi:LytTr DNA-binding domain-containing protein